MRRMIALLFALALLCMLASCAAPRKPEPEPEIAEEPETGEEPEPEEEPKPVRAAAFWYNFKYEHLRDVRKALEKELAEAGIEYTEYDANEEQKTQNDQIIEAIENGANLLILDIVDNQDEDNARWICDRAKEADIPVVFYNRWISFETLKDYNNVYRVSTDTSIEGKYQGKMIGKYLLEHYDEVDLNGDGVITYLVLKGNIGNPHCEALALYPVESCNEMLAAAGYPGIEYYDPENTDKFEPGGYDRDMTYEVTRRALEKFPLDGDHPVEMFISHSDMTLGIIDVLNELGYNDGGDKNVPVFNASYSDYHELDSGVTGMVVRSVKLETEALVSLVKLLAEGKEPYDSMPGYCTFDEEYPEIYVPYVEVMS